MAPDTGQETSRLTTPRAAAIAGVLFAVLMIAALVLIRMSIPTGSSDTGSWLASNSRTVVIALNLVPFAGIAFLWFIGVVRDRLGDREDRFFATVFLGSGLLFLAMLFTSAAVAGGVLVLAASVSNGLPESNVYSLGRAVTYVVLNTYGMRMAGVFMISTCTLFLRTKVTPRWMAFLGYILALVLLLTLSHYSWVSLLFPLWVLMISIQILIENLGRKASSTTFGVG